MSNILNDLEIDPDNFNWWSLAVCRGMDTNLFFDKYEVDEGIAKNIDEMCLACPVIAMCHESGKENSDHGVWGGIYLNSGSTDKSKNTHKTADVWKRLKVKNVHR